MLTIKFIQVSVMLILLGQPALAQSFGEEKDEIAFTLDTGERKWGDPPGCSTNGLAKTGHKSPERGWAIVSVSQAPIISRNGQSTFEQQAGGLDIITADEIDQAINLITAIVNDREKQVCIRDRMQSVRDAAVKASDTNNTLYGWVSAKAHGNCLFDRKSGRQHTNFNWRIMYLGGPGSANTHLQKAAKDCEVID